MADLLKIRIPLGLLLVLAGTLGYLHGTESGRAQRDVILIQLGRKQADEAPATSPPDVST